MEIPSDSDSDHTGPQPVVSEQKEAVKKARPRKKYEPYRSGQKSFDVPQMEDGDSNPQVEERFFTQYCPEWMQSCELELGRPSSTWRSAGSLRATCRCFEHEQCWAGKGRTFQLHVVRGREAHAHPSSDTVGWKLP